MGLYATISSGISNIKMSKQNKLGNSHFNVRFIPKRALLVSLMVLFGVSAALPIARAHADSITDQINALNAQNSQTQGALNGLQMQAASYQDAINQLQAQISGLQAAIAANQAHQADLEAQITADQEKLDQQKAGLGQDLKAMYVSGSMTTVEMLATSRSLSDYIDAQTYSRAVQSKIQSTLAQITELENELKAQKTQVDQLVVAEQQQQSSLAAAESQQQSLLAMNQSQQNAYNSQLTANNAKISQLQAEEAAALARLAGSGSVSIVSSGNCGGGYPGDAINSYGGHWGCAYGKDNGVDNWGMYNRECVSYTAWKVYQTYGPNAMPYWGALYANADGWPGDADAYHIPRGSTPKVGSVAIGTNPYWFGPVGHAMWVEAVSGNQILVSQMNFSGPGVYSEMWIDASLINTFIYFR